MKQQFMFDFYVSIETPCIYSHVQLNHCNSRLGPIYCKTFHFPINIILSNN